MIKTFADKRTQELYATTTERRCGMPVPSTRPRSVRPIHPGEMLREDFMPDYELTVASLAAALGVSRQTVNELVRERRALSADMALRLSMLFGNSADLWLDAQRAVDLWDAAQELERRGTRIERLGVA